MSELTTDDLFKDKLPDDPTGSQDDGGIQDPPENKLPVDPPADPPINPPADPPADSPEGGADPGQPADPPEGGDPPITSGIEMVLADYGVEGGMIVFEDGEKVHIDDLNETEQYNVMHSIFNGNRPSVEDQFDLSDDEVSLLNMVRDSGGSVEDAISDIVSGQVQKINQEQSAENIVWDDVPDDTVYMTFLKEISPDKSEDELLSDLATAKETSTFKDIINSKRKEFTNRQKAVVDERERKDTEDANTQLEEDRRTIVSAVSTIDNVAGFEITDDIKNILLEDMIEVNDRGDANLVGKVFSEPENIFKVAWFLKYGESSINEMEKYYRQELTKAYSRGRAEALGRLPESGPPTNLSGIRNTPEAIKDNFNTKPNAVTTDDLYLD